MNVFTYNDGYGCNVSSTLDMVHFLDAIEVESDVSVGKKEVPKHSYYLDDSSLIEAYVTLENVI